MSDSVPQLLIIYDQSGRLTGLHKDQAHACGVKQARLDLLDGLEGRDIYEIARKLAELLLEQIE